MTVLTDDQYNYSESVQLIHTLLANFVIFAILMIIFEFVRRKRSIYINRFVARFIATNRVPEKPSKIPFAWIIQVLRVSDREVLSMIGLDGYMFLRFISVCFRTAGFCTAWGLLILIPVYRYQGNDKIGWDGYTIGNIDVVQHSNRLWAPVFSAYVFSGFFCYLLYTEYKSFIHKRVEYLVHGDQDTPKQTYYTVMIERVPASLRSGPMLAGFFENLYPGEFHSAEVALDLHELEVLCAQRKETRDKLERSIAKCWAYNKRPTVWIKRSLYTDQEFPPEPVESNELAKDLGYDIVDAIKHYSRKLITLNESVHELQKNYFEQRKRLNELDQYRVLQIKKKLEDSTNELLTQVGSRFQNILSFETSPFHTDKEKQEESLKEYVKKLEADELESNASNDSRKLTMNHEFDLETGDNDNDDIELQLENDAPEESMATKASKIIALESKKTAEYAAKGALRGMLEATRALELLTFGANYRVSSTAFVTFKSRVAKCSAHQMLLSHEYYTLDVKPAPNPKEIIWENVSIPQTQIEIRRFIADVTFGVGALFWSLVITVISLITSLETLSYIFPGIRQYHDTSMYELINNLLFLSLLLILLAVLPFLFDFISRHYEGIKTETEIQNSIMNRYFYYQLANIFTMVGLGSIASSLQKIITNPNSILTILGSNIPSFSIYFANLVILRTFIALPVEMLRIIPLLDVLLVSLVKGKKAVTRRELRQGAFYDPPMLYGWCYPNILMVLTIMLTYCCISPFIIPLCLVYFGMVYIMYKYQLLFVYINTDQSGGHMWFAVFNRAMVSLIAGLMTLLCYLLLQSKHEAGPFYTLLPLPFFISYFWNHCENRIKAPTQSLSLEAAIHLDQITKEAKIRRESIPSDSFNSLFFRQPVLTEGKMKPSLYRHDKPMLPDNALNDNNDEDEVNSLSNGYGKGLRYNKIDNNEVKSPLHSLAGSILSHVDEDQIIKDKLENSPKRKVKFDSNQDFDDIPTRDRSASRAGGRLRRGSLEGFEIDEDFDKEVYEKDVDEAVNRYLESDRGFFFTFQKSSYYKYMLNKKQSSSNNSFEYINSSNVVSYDNDSMKSNEDIHQVLSPFHQSSSSDIRSNSINNHNDIIIPPTQSFTQESYQYDSIEEPETKQNESKYGATGITNYDLQI